ARWCVIAGTSHSSPDRFTLTRKDFKTPLGTVPTDRAFLDRLVAHYGDGLFDDEATHLREHSIELEVAVLQYVYEGRHDIRIVPLLAGGFHDYVRLDAAPRTQPDVARMIEALRRAGAGAPEAGCYLIRGDLAPLGP